MNNKFQAWLYAFRLRTLPLAFSSILTGSFIAFHQSFSWLILGLCLFTTLLLQVLSNLANDYGDSEKGTDNEDRIGPKRAVQAGLLSYSEIKTGIVVCTLLAFISGCILIWTSFGSASLSALLFLGLGFSAIAAAIKYTVGKGAYGYRGLGDVFVLLFFGIVGVVGSYYLQSHFFDERIFLPALSIGCFAAGVLNLNNMRDRISDAKAGKITLVVKMGGENAKRYHLLLLVVGWLACVVFECLNFQTPLQFLFILSAPLFWKNMLAVASITEPSDFDPLLKQLAIATFIFSILFSIGQVLCI